MSSHSTLILLKARDRVLSGSPPLWKAVRFSDWAKVAVPLPWPMSVERSFDRRWFDGPPTLLGSAPTPPSCKSQL